MPGTKHPLTVTFFPFAHNNDAMAMQTTAANILIGLEGWLVTDIIFTTSFLE